MNTCLKNLNRIEFVVTAACTGHCKHCSQGEHKTNEHIDKNLAADAVHKIAREYNITSVMTFGGEPLLCPDTVCEIHKAAKEMDIAQRQLITNGFFSKDTNRITLVADCLIESGVNEILLSVDAFHQETIPIAPVITFAKAVQQYHTVQLQVHPAWLVSTEDDNAYNIKTREFLKQFNDIGIETAEGNVIFPSGNALKYLSEYFDLSKTDKNPYWEDPTDVRAICFSANGDILGGNIYKQDISEILSTYTPKGA
ncbi:MAG: radical SAM protein [Clostridia bacterium]|nr:radical SAM protein [Clostridia bacterium]